MGAFMAMVLDTGGTKRRALRAGVDSAGRLYEGHVSRLVLDDPQVSSDTASHCPHLDPIRDSPAVIRWLRTRAFLEAAKLSRGAAVRPIFSQI